MKQVRGEPSRFALDGGHPAVDFANTMYGGNDAFASFKDVAAWLRESGLERRRLAPCASAEQMWALREVRRFREIARAVLESALAGKPVPSNALAAINAALRDVKATVAKRGDAYALDVAWTYDSPRDAIAPLARAIASFLTEADRGRVKRCPGCGMFIYDTSKNRTRNWCSMKTCGNRAKAAAHYRRTKGRTS
jgi:predicted RNA-binding Zn ribbon-like protein